jgi:dihydropteroate synthase
MSDDAARLNVRLLEVEGAEDARRILGELGTDPAGAAIMSRKMVTASVSVENVQARASHIIKQVMLSKGGDCATPRDVFLIDGKDLVNVILIGTEKQLSEAAKSLTAQPFGCKALASELKGFIAGSLGEGGGTRTLRAGDYQLALGGRTLVMGIVNVTPDSFSDGGEFVSFEAARLRALEMAAAGADIIDIGGESTRPGAEAVSLSEEERRTIPLIEAIAAEVRIPISIDTYKSEIAARAMDAGACMVNDVSALRLDERMAPLVAERGVPVILMHMQGMPRNMQENPSYDDVVADISRFLLERARHAIAAGIAPEQVLIDPGIGFGKTVEHNLEIIRRLSEFASLGYPLVLGTSRKRFIGSVTGRVVTERIMGTAASVAFSIARGVDVVRVHDVEEMLEVVKMADAIAGRERPQ